MCNECLKPKKQIFGSLLTNIFSYALECSQKHNIDITNDMLNKVKESLVKNPNFIDSYHFDLECDFNIIRLMINGDMESIENICINEMKKTTDNRRLVKMYNLSNTVDVILSACYIKNREVIRPSLINILPFHKGLSNIVIDHLIITNKIMENDAKKT
jgi:hypothetical protein